MTLIATNKEPRTVGRKWRIALFERKNQAVKRCFFPEVCGVYFTLRRSAAFYGYSGTLDQALDKKSPRVKRRLSTPVPILLPYRCHQESLSSVRSILNPDPPGIVFWSTKPLAGT